MIPVLRANLFTINAGSSNGWTKSAASDWSSVWNQSEAPSFVSKAIRLRRGGGRGVPLAGELGEALVGHFVDVLVEPGVGGVDVGVQVADRQQGAEVDVLFGQHRRPFQLAAVHEQR